MKKKRLTVKDFKNIPFAKRIDMLRKIGREAFKKAGYTQKDIPRLIAEVRAEKRKKDKTNDIKFGSWKIEVQ